MRHELPELLAAQIAYLAHVAQDGQHPHLAAVFGAAPAPDAAAPPTAEEGLGRMLAIVLDGVFGPAAV